MPLHARSGFLSRSAFLASGTEDFIGADGRLRTHHVHTQPRKCGRDLVLVQAPAQRVPPPLLCAAGGHGRPVQAAVAAPQVAGVARRQRFVGGEGEGARGQRVHGAPRYAVLGPCMFPAKAERMQMRMAA